MTTRRRIELGCVVSESMIGYLKAHIITNAKEQQMKKLYVRWFNTNKSKAAYFSLFNVEVRITFNPNGHAVATKEKNAKHWSVQYMSDAVAVNKTTAKHIVQYAHEHMFPIVKANIARTN